MKGEHKVKKKSIASLLISGIIFSQLAPIVSFAVEQAANEKPTELTQLEETPNSTDEKTNEELNQTEIEEQEIQDEKSQDTKSNTSKEQSQTQKSSKESNETTNTQSEISAEQATTEKSDVEKDVNPEIIKGSWGTAPYEYNQDTGELKVGGGDLSNWFNTTGFLISKADDAEVKKIVFTEPVNAPSDSTRLFDGSEFKSLEEICDLSYLDTSKVRLMQSMFAGLQHVKSIDFSGFDTKNVTNMYGVFAGSTGLESLDLRSFDTKNVTDMINFFHNVINIKSLDLSSFDTNAAIGNMGNFFSGVVNITHIKFGEKFKFLESKNTRLPEVSTEAPYIGKWINNRTKEKYTSNELVSKYNGATMSGDYYRFAVNSMEAIDSTVYVGDDWKAEYNFISATDKFGNSANFKDMQDIKVEGTVDTTKAGTNKITYIFGNLSKEVTVTVKENQSTLEAKDSALYTGDTWNAKDNFISATDKEGNPVDFKDIKVEGTVNTTKPGTNKVTYLYGNQSKEVTITVKADQSTLEVKDSIIYTGDKWNPKDNFITATDKDGNPVDFKDIKVEGTVDTTKAGTNKITYIYGNLSKEVTVTVKANQATLEAKDSALYVGDTWNAKDNFISATDKDGNPVDFKDIKVEGTVDTTKAGTNKVTYLYGNQSKEVTVTVKADQTTLEAKDSVIYTGDKWKAEDNFISATDKTGNSVDFKDIKVEGTVDTTKAGTNKVTYTYANQSKEVTITVKADQATLEAKDSIIYTGDKWKAEDNFISATDKAGKTIDFKKIKVEGTVDTTKAGDYDITYSYSGVTRSTELSKTITVTVKKNQANLEAKDSTLYEGDKWIAKDNFVSATDKDGNTVDFKAIEVKGTVNTTKAGTYKITYSYAGISKTITVTVLANQTKIVAKDLTIYEGDNWKEQDNFVSATDKFGQAIDFNSVKVTGSVDIQTPGKYRITYSIEGASTTITVTVLADQSNLVAKNSTIYVGDKWQSKDNFVSATDKYGKPIDLSLLTVTGTVDTTTPGEYEITYSVNGLTTTITVTVKENQANIVAEDSTIHAKESWKAADNFVSATDKTGKNIGLSSVSVTGKVDINTPGNYEITYTIDGVSTTITVTVLVNHSQIEAHDAKIKVGTSWKPEDSFILAKDKFGETADFSDVTVEGTVDTSKPGKYQITYTIDGVSVTITVIVEDNSKGSSNTITIPPTNHSIGEEETSNSTDKQLPKTGEQQNNFFLLGGLVLVALAFILGKRKMYK
ncbi:DUF5011 domain-containing protein [Listeria innocua]|nr:DUF5011 domain-containing protein [Listeria innocua]